MAAFLCTPHVPCSPCRTPPLQEALAIIVDAMHAYFLPVRFYSRYYPYFGFRSAMVHIALERTRQVGPAGCRGMRT